MTLVGEHFLKLWPDSVSPIGSFDVKRIGRVHTEQGTVKYSAQTRIIENEINVPVFYAIEETHDNVWFI
ncbi:MAG: hypothetical protein ABSB40_02880 [Nitrososphaeria archaeon]|jgi:hypothetical protein